MSKVLTYTITNKYAEKPKADENDKQHKESTSEHGKVPLSHKHTITTTVIKYHKSLSILTAIFQMDLG